jgi:hypothetical protein
VRLIVRGSTVAQTATAAPAAAPASPSSRRATPHPGVATLKP